MKAFKNHILLFTMAVLISGCKDNSPENNPEPEENPRYVVEIEAIDYAFNMPSEIRSGWVTFQFENVGHEMHFGMLLRFNQPLTEEDFHTFLNDPNPETFERYIKEPPTIVGGPGFHSQGQESEITLYLEPGNYAMMCNTRTAEGEVHADLGMRKFLTVSEESSDSEEPGADMTLSLEKYVIDAAGNLKSGRQTIAVEHTGGDSFDVHLVQLNDSSTIPATMDFMDDMQEPTRVLFEGGAEQTALDQKSYVAIDLEPGDYMFVSHEYGALGMIKEFSIPGDDRQIDFERESMPPSREITVNIEENNIELPSEIESGPVSFTYEDATNDEHEIRLFRLEDGQTVPHFLTYAERMKEAEEKEEPIDLSNPTLGYSAELKEEESFPFNLRPGTYMVLCFYAPEEAEAEHFFQGEIQEFEVR